MADDDRIPCKVCARRFAPDVLAKHQKICKSVSKPRKVFDSSKQRATGDLSVKQIKQAQKKDIDAPKTHWREKHQDFINAIRSSKGVSHALNTGGPLPPPPPPSLNPDYVQCSYCSRRFNAKAADRHISFCKEQSLRLPKGKPDPAAKAKQSTRLNYQAPRPAGKPSQATAPAGRTGASGRGAGTPGSRAPGAARGRAGGIPAGRCNAQEDEFSPSGQGMYSGVESTASAFDTSPVPSSRSGYSSNNSYSNRHPPRGKLQQTRTQGHHSKASHSSSSSHYQQKKTPPASQKSPSKYNNNMYAENDYNSFADSDHSEKHMNNFPDHFNKRYKTNPNANSPVPSYTKNKPPTHFQYLNSIEKDGPYDDDDDEEGIYLYSNNTPPPASLYGHSKPTSRLSPHSSNPQRDGHNGHREHYSNNNESNAPAGSRTKLSYCQECGAKHPTAEAKFCCECGMKRPDIHHGEPGGGSGGGGGARYSRLKH